jgi:hypothetical protein
MEAAYLQMLDGTNAVMLIVSGRFWHSLTKWEMLSHLVLRTNPRRSLEEEPAVNVRLMSLRTFQSH